MAISYQNFGTVTTIGSGVTSITLPAPSGASATDVVLAVLYGNFGTGTITPPSGWTLVNRTASGTTQNMAVYWALGSASFGAWTVPAPPTGGGMVGFTLGYTGVDNTTPMDVTAAGQVNGASSTYTAPSVTTVTDNAWYVCFFGVDDTANGSVPTITAGSGLTDRAQGGVVGSGGPPGGRRTLSAEGSDGIKATAGAVGTHTASSSINNVNIGVTAALRPAPPSGAITSNILAVGSIPTQTLRGSGALSDSILAAASMTSTLKGAGILAQSVVASASMTNTLKGSGVLANSILASASLSSTVRGSGALAKNILAGASVLADLTVPAGPITASILASASVTNNLRGAGALVNLTLAQASLVSTLRGSGLLSESILAAATMTTTLRGAGALAKAITAQASLTPTLRGAGVLAGSIVGAATTSGPLLGSGALASALLAVATLVTTLRGSGALSDSILASAILTATLFDSGAGPTSSMTAHATVVGALSGLGSLVDSILASAVVASTLRGSGALSDVIQAQAAVASLLRGIGALANTVQAGAAVAGTARGAGVLSNSIVSSASCTSVLRGSGRLVSSPVAGAVLSASGLAYAFASASLVGHAVMHADFGNSVFGVLFVKLAVNPELGATAVLELPLHATETTTPAMLAKASLTTPLLAKGLTITPY